VRFPRYSLGLSALFATFLSAAPAAAFPGFMAGKGKPPVVHATHVVVMKKGPATAVTVMPDYQGSLEPFVVVLAVPPDVVADHVVTLKREFVDHVDTLSAPRFHEFWEQDPCDQGPTEQEWQRNLKVSGSGFLGGPDPTQGAQRKVAPELSLDIVPKTKEGEYKMTVLAAGASPLAWLKEKGYAVPPGADQALAPYSGLAWVMAEVDTRRIELVGGDRAQLSPIRFYTDQPYDTLPSRIGLLNAPEKDMQEILLYAFDPENRYEVGNYQNVTPPTNIEIEFEAKERMGEFYNSLYDTILAKNPEAVLREYTWSATEGCGQPCATEPMMLFELLSLGGDVFERSVPDEEKLPKPPELTAEEQAQDKELLKPLKPKEKREKMQELKADREKIAAVKALVARHKYLLSRLHYRYDAKTLAKDLKLTAIKGSLDGGTALPKGQKREANTAVTAAETGKHQTRFNNFHNWKPVIHCQGPERWRWGKSPPDYRGLRKVWIAEDFTRKSRTQVPAKKVIVTSIPELKLGAGFAEPADAGADAADGGTAVDSGKGCGCRTVGTERSGSAGLLLALGVALAAVRRRRSRRA
jgi:MYXO-CTERM domain-containing protein